jgi:hypothetical protein
MSAVERRRLSALYIVGGLLVGVAASALFLRKEAVGAWSDFVQFLILAGPFALLFALGAGLGPRVAAGSDLEERPAWQPVLLVFCALLAPVVLFAFLDVIGGGARSPLTTAWIFAVAAALAAYLALVRGVAVGVLLATLSLLVAWLALWDQLAGDPAAKTVRQLLATFSVLVTGAAILLRARGLRDVSGVVTGAGVAAVAAGAMGIVGTQLQQAALFIAGPFGDVGSLNDLVQQLHWDVFLLLASLALVLYGAIVSARGPVYVGAIGLAAFTLSIGSEIVAVAKGEEPQGSLLGWPLVLLLAGALALAAAFMLGRPSATRHSTAARAGPGSRAER